MAYRVGVDIGGTFTDFCAFDEDTNELHALKVLSTPDKPGAEVMQGIDMIGRIAPELPVFCSSDVWPITREYERTTPAVIHGYVQPRVERYLTSLHAPSPGPASPPSPW